MCDPITMSVKGIGAGEGQVRPLFAVLGKHKGLCYKHGILSDHTWRGVCSWAL